MKRNILSYIKTQGKKVIALTLIGAMCLTTLAGCGSALDKNGGYSKEDAETVEVLKIGDYRITLDEALLYLFMQIYQNGITESAIEAYSKTARSNALTQMRQNYIIYDVAMHNDCSPTDADIQTSNTFADNFIAAFRPVLDKYGISDEVVKETFYKQMVVEKFEQDIKNSMGKDINDDLDEKFKDTKFFTTYMYQIPTVKVGEDNEPVKDEAGNMVQLTEAEKEEKLKQAEEIRTEALKAGADLDAHKAIAEKYGIAFCSAESSGYVGMYNDEYNKIFDELKAGEITEVRGLDKGYVFYVMITENDESLRAAYTYTLAKEVLDSEFEKLENSWLSTIEIDTENDIIGDTWDNIDLKQICKDMTDAGVVGQTTEK